MSFLFALKGRQGDKGDEGDKGDQGDKGDKGDTGEAGFFTSRCSVWRNGNQGIPNGATTRIDFNAVIYDNEDEFDEVTDHCFKAKQAGVYRVSCGFGLSPIKIGTAIYGYIYKNGANCKHRMATHYPHTVGFWYLGGDIELDVDEFIDVRVYHTDLTTPNIQGTVNNTFLDIHQIA